MCGNRKASEHCIDAGAAESVHAVVMIKRTINAVNTDCVHVKLLEEW